MKNWFLLGLLLAFGLLTSPLFSLPPDPGGGLYQPAVSFAPAELQAPATISAVESQGTVMESGFMATLLSIIVLSLLYAALTGPINAIPERYDKFVSLLEWRSRQALSNFTGRFRSRATA